MNTPYPLTHTFVLRVLEDATNLVFATPIFWIVAFMFMLMILAILKIIFNLFR